MSFRATLDVLDLLDDPEVDGHAVARAFEPVLHVDVQRVDGEKGYTHFVTARTSGKNGKSRGGSAPTLGVIGRLGGVGARPEIVGLVSDGDGAVAALATALKLGRMAKKGDALWGDVIVSTHICPRAPIQPHDPVPFMGAPVDMATMNRHEVSCEMDAVISIDTTKGNRIINHRGFAISPTIKEGYILRVSENLLDIMSVTTGRPPVTFPATMQDITPYGNGLFHVNSIFQPATATGAPVVGLAITTETAVPGCASGASHAADIEEAVRFVVEVCKSFGAGKCSFCDPQEYEMLLSLYGSMRILQTPGSAR